MKTITKLFFPIVLILILSSCSMFEDRALNYKKNPDKNKIKLQKQETKDEIKTKVLSVIETMEKGFNKQNTLGLRDVLDTFTQDGRIEVVLANATFNSGKGWECDRESLYESFKQQMDYFERIDFNIKDTNINSRGEVAWLSTAGTVEYTAIKEKEYNKLLNEIKLELADGEDSELNVVKYLMGFLSELLFIEKKPHNRFVLPIRITGVLVRENNKWLFHQLALSFPVDVKVLKSVSVL